MVLSDDDDDDDLSAELPLFPDFPISVNPTLLLLSLDMLIVVERFLPTVLVGVVGINARDDNDDEDVRQR